MYVSDAKGLRALVKSVRGAEFVALDTEFMRERTYYAKLCLIQIATDDLQAIVDPISIADLDPLLELFSDVRTTKVFHAGSQDMEIFYQLFGCVPAPVFDTQVAATLAGYPAQVGYAQLVHEVCDVRLDKSDTYTDWSRRPLSGTQIEYALNDVRYLPRIYRELRERLAAEGRLGWLEPDFDGLADPATYEVVPEEKYRRVKRMASLKPRQLGVLMVLTAWREREAQRRDIPRRWVLSDESLLEIARRSPSNATELAEVRGVADKLPKSAYKGVLSVVAQGLALSESELPQIVRRKRRPVDVDGVVDLMAAIVRLRAKEHGVAAPLLASREDLEHLAAGEREDSVLLTGWRRSIVGDELCALLDGHLALRIDDTKIVVEEYEGSRRE